MTTIDFITELLCRIDDAMPVVPKLPQASLYPSERATLGTACGVFALKGAGERAFYRWIARDYRPLFPHLPERTRLYRLFKTDRAWSDHSRSVAQPSLLGVADTYGIELLNPRREGRIPRQLRNKGPSNWRWIIGAKLGCVLNPLGLVCAWDCNLASIVDKDFRPLVAQFVGEMVVLVGSAFRGAGGPAQHVVHLPAMRLRGQTQSTLSKHLLLRGLRLFWSRRPHRGGEHQPPAVVNQPNVPTPASLATPPEVSGTSHPLPAGV